jgi:hypothetical protein
LLADPTLAMCADVLDDLETVRIANENRLRTLTDSGERGHGLDIDNPDVARLAQLVDALKAAEHTAELNLGRVMRRHPLGAFIKSRNGIGEKQGARLLAAIGDPFWNDLMNRPRTVRELYAFCGMGVVHELGGVDVHTPIDRQAGCGIDTTKPGAAHVASDSHGLTGGATDDTTTQADYDSQNPSGGGVAPKRRKGAHVNWSPEARKRTWLIADKCIQTLSSPYRPIYDEGRIKYADSTHNQPCPQCGPKGKPAPIGSPLSAGHQHSRARRLIAKEILKELWREARRLHTAQSKPDGHVTRGGVEDDSPHTAQEERDSQPNVGGAR